MKVKNEFKKLFIEEKIFSTLEEMLEYQYQLIDSERREENYFFRFNKTTLDNNYFLEIYKLISK